jgi:hypothetical protein
MIDLQTAMLFAQWSVEDRAKAEGRRATEAEYAAAWRETWDRYIEAGTMHTLAQARAAAAMRPRRGLLRWLFGARAAERMAA